MQKCPYCGGDNVEYIGYSDGAGDEGNSVSEDWECHDCHVVFSAAEYPVEDVFYIDWYQDHPPTDSH